MAFASAIMAGVQNFVGGLQMYVDNKAKAKEAKRNAAIAEFNAKAQAQAYESQAKIAAIKAIQAQRQGDEEAAKRYRVMAQDIGSLYANYGGNGLMVDGATEDTLGDALRTTTQEGSYDVGIINENAGMNIWTYAETAKAHRQSAANTLTMGKMEVKAYKDQYKSYKTAAKQGIMQTVSGVPAAVWKAAGVNSYHKFGGIWGGSMTLMPYGGPITGYGISKLV